ncbi:MAG: hypothetical protein MR387_06130 [Phocaeicola plebeius]|nr:hypothetical protein [Phocaeicola plebeius]
MNIEENKKLWAKIVAKAWCDEAYKAELLNNPEQVLKAEGAEIPEGVRVHCGGRAEALDSGGHLSLLTACKPYYHT